MSTDQSDESSEDTFNVLTSPDTMTNDQKKVFKELVISNKQSWGIPQQNKSNKNLREMNIRAEVPQTKKSNKK